MGKRQDLTRIKFTAFSSIKLLKVTWKFILITSCYWVKESGSCCCDHITCVPLHRIVICFIERPGPSDTKISSLFYHTTEKKQRQVLQRLTMQILEMFVQKKICWSKISQICFILNSYIKNWLLTDNLFLKKTWKMNEF